MDNVVYRLWLKYAASNSQAKKLIDKYKTAENVYKQTDYEDCPFLPEKSIKKLSDKSLDRAEQILERCRELGIEVLAPESDKYPSMLKTLLSPPCVLFAKGNIPDWESILTIGVVGTRRASVYGREITEKLSSDIAKSGAVIVSGFAEGVDTIAATCAVNQDTPTIAVLGCGVDIVYPARNKKLYDKVLEKGLFISEHEPGTPPVYFNFPVRNEIIVALSKCVLVTEAPMKSGAMITAKMALGKKKPVFTVPGQINRKTSDGTNFLIKKGARTVLSSDDILSEFQIYTLSEEKASSPEPETDPILISLDDGDLNMDELCQKTKLSAGELNSRCFMLELSSKIQKLPGGFYHKK